MINARVDNTVDKYKKKGLFKSDDSVYNGSDKKLQ